MPELPEIETIKRVIEPQIKGLMIMKVEVRRPEVVAYPDAEGFCRRLAGQAIDCMVRRGEIFDNDIGEWGLCYSASADDGMPAGGSGGFPGGKAYAYCLLPE